MRTLTTLFLALVISVGTAYSQPIKDKAILPVGITLNSVLRLDITSGGAIEFVFNNLTDYTDGINAGGGDPLYQTTFTVASSTDWDLNMWSEAGFVGSNGGSITLDHLEYIITATGAHQHGAELTINTNGGQVAMTNGSVAVIIGTDAAGSIADNAFTVDWIAGESNDFLNESYPSDRYVANIIMELVAK